MKPKEIRKWFLLLTFALSLVSSEYCSGDQTDTVKYERQRESQNSIEKRFQENDRQILISKPLTHRYQVKNTREKMFHQSDSPNAAKTVRNRILQSSQVIRRRQIPNELNIIPSFRSTEIRRYDVSGQRINGISDSDVEMTPVRNTRTSQISSKTDTLTFPDQAITRKIIHKRRDKLHLKENSNIQKENGRCNSQSNRRTHKNPGERNTIFKANRIRILNNENLQKQQYNIRGENTGTVSRERLTVRKRFDNMNRNFTEKDENATTKNKLFLSNPANEIARILNIRSRVYERKFNRIEHNRFNRTETINAIRGKSALRRTEIRFTAEKKQDTAPLSVTSMSLRRSRITEIPDKNNNILRRAVRVVSLATRDDPQSTLHSNVDRTTRKELINGRYMNRNDRIMRENLRYASTVTRFQSTAETDTSTEQNVRRISTRLPSETSEGRKSRYAIYSHSNSLKVISTENRNSKQSIQDRKENRLTTRGTDEREYRLKTYNIERLSPKRMVVQVTRSRDNINSYRFDTNRTVELTNLGEGKSTILVYGVRSYINTRRNKRYLSRTTDMITAETRKGIEINIFESATRKTIQKKDMSIRRLVDRILEPSENKYPDHYRYIKEISNADQRSLVFSKRRNLMHAGRDQTKQRQMAEPGNIRKVRKFERNTIFRVNERNTEERLNQHNDERKVISRKKGMYQKLDLDFRGLSFSGAMQIRKEINVLKLREENRQSTRYHERHITDNIDERMKAVRIRALQLRYNGRLSTEEIAFQTMINPGKINRNIPSFIRSDEYTLLNPNMEVRMRTTERNGRGFRGKLDILRRYAVNRQMKPYKENEYFTHVIKSFENKLPLKTVQDRVLRTERNNRGSKNYKLEHFFSGGEIIQASNDRASQRLRINVSSSVKNSDKRIYGEEIREKRAVRERSRRVYADQSRNIERHDERKMANVKIQERLIITQGSGVKSNVNKQNDSPMIPRNGRGFRDKGTNFVRTERILKYNYNRNNLLLTVFYRKQNSSLQAQVLKPVENNIRFTVFRTASRKFFFDKNTEKARNYERAFFENQRNNSNNQRALLKNTWKMNSNRNIFAVQQTPNRDIYYMHRNFHERNIPFKTHYSSNSRENDRILSLNQLTSRRHAMRVERFSENSGTGREKTCVMRTTEETKLDNIRQIIANHRLSEDIILPVYGSLGSPFISKDITFENRLINSPQMYSSQKGHLNANGNWNMRTVFTLTAYIILGLFIIMAASESDPFKCTSFKQRLFDALSLRTEVF